MTSLPVPLSPVMITLLSLRLTTLTKSKIARIRALWPTTMLSNENCSGAFIARPSEEVLQDLQLLEFLDFLAQRHLDTHVERHVGARASRAHAGQPHARAVAVHLDELDVAAVCLHHGPDPIQD